MTKQVGRLFLLKVSDGAATPAFVTVAGLQAKKVSITNGEEDVTTFNPDDPGAVLWTDVMEGAKRITFSGTGIFEDSVGEGLVHEIAMADRPIGEFQIIVPGRGTYEGNFLIPQFDFSGELQGGTAYEISLSSCGEITYTPEA